MRILIYSLNFYPELTGIGKYSAELADWLKKNNHDVRVITSPPYYPNWKIADGYKSWVWSFEKWKNISLWRCPIWIPSKPTGFKRLLHLLTFALTSMPVLLLQMFWRPNIVFVVEPPFFAAPLALVFAKICQSKSILHIQDYEIDAAFELGILKGIKLRKIVLYIESALMRQFDVVSTISNRMLAVAKEKQVESERLLILPNWVDISEFDVTYSDNERFLYREHLGIPQDKIIALYSGNMGAKQGLEMLSSLARMCNDDSVANQVFFVFCGNGVGRDLLIRETKNLPNVKFLDLQPAELLPKFFNAIDIHLLPQRADVSDLVMPSKLTGMLASGRPVLALANPGTELANILQGRGVVATPGDSKAFFDKLLMLVCDPKLRSKLGEAGRSYAMKNLDQQKILSDFGSFLSKLAG